MAIGSTPTITLGSIKRRAKQIRKNQGISHVAALDVAAQYEGYQSWAPPKTG
jgi:hypothetical protein